MPSTSDASAPRLGSISKSRAVLLQGAAKLLGAGLQFFFVRICIRKLGGEYDAYLFAFSCAAFIGLLDFGLPPALQRFLGAALATNDLPRVAALYRFARRAHALLATASILLWIGFGLYFERFGRTKLTDPGFALLLYCGLQNSAGLFYSPAMSLANALERFREVAAVNMVSGLLAPAVGIAVLTRYPTAEALALSGLVCVVATAFVAFGLSGGRKLPPAGRLSREDKRGVVGLGARSYPTSITTVVGNNADKVMVQRAGVAGSLSSYYVARRVPEQIYQVVFPITNTIFPELTRLASTDDGAFSRAVERSVRFTLALAFSMELVPCAFSGCILRFWLHSSFVDANPGVLFVLPFMAFYSSMELVYGVITMAYFARGVPQRVLPFSVFNALVTVFATVPMFRWQGIAGVGLMNALIDSAQIIPMVLCLKRFAAPGVRLSELWSAFGSLLAISLAIFAALHFGVDAPLSHSSPLLGALLAIPASLLTLLLMTRLGLCPTPDGVAARLRRFWLIGPYLVRSST